MDKFQREINFLTKLKMSLGIDTRSDEIEMDLKDLRTKQERIQSDIETSSNKLSKIDACINNINKIFELSEEDIQNGEAVKYSSQLTSYELSIERAKRQKVDISVITNMQLMYQKKKEEFVNEYINDIISNTNIHNGNSNEILILLNDIKHNLQKLKINSEINNITDLKKIKKNLLSMRNPVKYKNDDSMSVNNELNRQIVNIETSKEKYYADYAKEQANKRRK